MKIGLNFHFSDTWTNSALQGIPSGWPTDIDGLGQTIYTYTLDCLNHSAAAGLKPGTITLGNEVNSGILVPVGGYDKPRNLSRLPKPALPGRLRYSYALDVSPLGENASFSKFIDLSARLKSKYGNKEVQVVETGWPLACPNSEYKFPLDQTDIPWSSEGQEIYFQRMAKTLTVAGATGFNV
ncbi:unnamed protein product, partial [Clonostachys rhizophaga]